LEKCYAEHSQNRQKASLVLAFWHIRHIFLGIRLQFLPEKREVTVLVRKNFSPSEVKGFETKFFIYLMRILLI